MRLLRNSEQQKCAAFVSRVPLNSKCSLCAFEQQDVTIPAKNRHAVISRVFRSPVEDRRLKGSFVRYDNNTFASLVASYQQKPNNRILLLPFINGSQAQKIRLLDFWTAKDDLYSGVKSRGDLQRKDTIHISEQRVFK